MDRKAFLDWFNPQFQNIVSEKIAELQELLGDEFLESLTAHIGALSKGGMRIRPYISYLAASERGDDEYSQLVKVFAAIELFHVFGLIHDDYIDRASLRRGVPTLHIEAETRMNSGERSGDIAHMSGAQAILLGDLVHGWVIELFDDLQQHYGDAGLAAQRELQYMTREVVAGQMIDVDLMTKQEANAALIERKMELKTASYTFTRPMRIGYAISGGKKEDFAFADQFGKELGLGFQIQDDYLDIFGDPEKTGKANFSDLEEGQHTYFTQYLFEHGSDEHIAALHTIFRQKITLSCTDVHALFDESGAKEAGLQRMKAHFDAARALLNEYGRAEGGFSDLLTMIESRTC
jgi:geranylgeranyl diphosphate synthase type I